MLTNIDKKRAYPCSPLTNSEGFTPFLMAAKKYKSLTNIQKEHFENFLTDYNIDETNDKGWTALMLASRNSNATSTEKTVQMLIGAGADLNLQNSNGWTALMLASRNSNTTSTEKTVQMLIDAGVDLNLQNSNGWTALMFAARNSNEDSTEKTVQMLIDAGADLNLQNNKGWTALMLAATYSNEDSTEKTVKVLIDAGADLNLQNDMGWTVLMTSARYSNETSTEKTVQMLIDAGADITQMTLSKMYGLSAEITYQKLHLLLNDKKQYTRTIAKITNQEPKNFKRKDIASLKTLLLMAKRSPIFSYIIKYKLLKILFC